jgi:hypothetical protein
MIEITGNIWDYYDKGYNICITTNGFVKKDGCATMGRGTALQAKRRFNGIDRKLGSMLGGPTGITEPSRWMFVEEIAPRVFNFPVKRDLGICSPGNVVEHMTWKFKIGELVPGWALKVEIEIIKKSLLILSIQHFNKRFNEIILPRPGCGAGELNWEWDVKPLCEEYGDWLSVITLK